MDLTSTSKNFDGNEEIGGCAHKIDFGPKTALLGPKRATLGNRCRKTARRAAKRPPTGKPKVSRVTSGYGGLMIQMSRVRLSQKNGGYIGVAKKMLNFGDGGDGVFVIEIHNLHLWSGASQSRDFDLNCFLHHPGTIPHP